MISIDKSVAGIFVTKDIKKDVSNFTNEYIENIPGFIGINFNDNSDLLTFNFNENEITYSEANNQLTDALNGYLPSSINLLKREIKDLVNLERDNRLYSYFPCVGFRWDCNVESRANIIGTICMALMNGGALPPGVVWRDYDNVNHPCDFPYLANLGSSMFIYSQQVYGASWYHKSTIDSLSNPTQILNYDFTGNWPARGV